MHSIESTPGDSVVRAKCTGQLQASFWVVGRERVKAPDRRGGAGHSQPRPHSLLGPWLRSNLEAALPACRECLVGSHQPSLISRALLSLVGFSLLQPGKTAGCQGLRPLPVPHGRVSVFCTLETLSVKHPSLTLPTVKTEVHASLSEEALGIEACWGQASLQPGTSLLTAGLHPYSLL